MRSWLIRYARTEAEVHAAPEGAEIVLVRNHHGAYAPAMIVEEEMREDTDGAFCDGYDKGYLAGWKAAQEAAAALTDELNCIDVTRDAIKEAIEAMEPPHE